jgi:FkbM family methyltransferase
VNLTALRTRARKLLKESIAQCGIEIRRVPRSLLKNSDDMLLPTLEHLALRRQLDLGGEPFYFLQIGAYDGRTGDPIFLCARKYGWHGMLVEPQPRYFEALRTNYGPAPDLVFKNVAVSDRREQRLLYTIREDSNRQSHWAPQMASFDKGYLLGQGFMEEDLAAVAVECVTVDDLLDELPSARLDLLQIDVEGYDFEVLRRFNFDRCKPSIVRFEHKHISRRDHDSSVRLLLRHGYQIAVEREGDTMAWLRRSTETPSQCSS